MIITGIVVYAGAAFYKTNRTETVTETTPVETETSAAVETTEYETESVEVVEKTVFEPTPDELNLAHYFPDEADESDITQSYAGEAFRILMTQDDNWMSGIYSYADLSPEQLAARIGRLRTDVMGRYNPKDSSQDPNDSETWTIRSFKDIRMSVTDGDGNPISVYSNVIDIMSMANVYTYYHAVEDYDTFLSYAKSLWEASHSYSVSMSDVYYCSGCLDDDAELRELEALEEAAIAEAAGLLPEEGSLAEGASVSSYDETEESSSAVITSNRRDSASEYTQTETESMGTETSVSGSEEAYSEDVAAASQELMLETDPETLSAAVETQLYENDPAAEAVMDESVAETMTETVAETAKETLSVATGSDAERVEDSADASIKSKTVARNSCPGHIDLIIYMKIRGLDEKNGLYAVDAAGNAPEQIGAGGWEGWTDENRTYAHNLSYLDWYERYGLSLSIITMRNPLTAAEIEEYMNLLPEDISEDRRAVIEFALSSVGKVPYYWGGKASRAGYEGNQFGSLVGADIKGRVLKGLDCSGWINWVYWSALGQRLPYESTSGLAVLGSKISRDQLQPGDIVVRTGEDAHVIMFLGWTEDGKILCIHESSAGVNNVTVATRDAYWPYYRRLLD
jgi:cell wall-associated NlpC family hydrolase